MKQKLLIALIIAAVLIWRQGRYLLPSQCSQITFLDVGQGDSILVSTPKHHNILIDGGPGQVVLDRLSQVMPWWDRKIDLLVLTHPHADHLDGLLAVSQRFDIEEIVLGGTPTFNPADAELYKQNVVYNFASSQTKRLVDNALIEIIYPEQPFLGRDPPDNLNNVSLVGRVTIDGFRLLFTGDAENEEELDLVNTPNDYQADLFSAGHHGSRTSNSLALLNLINPAYVVIQSSLDGGYGHPHAEALSNFAQIGAQVFRTDYHGTINFELCNGVVDAIQTSR